MPSAYSHFIMARQSLLSLPPRIQDKITPYLSLYYFGAQGADFCFFYKFMRRKKLNLGSHLHRVGVYTAFQCMQRFSAQSPAIFAYSAGYLTHYAADSILHPYVCAVAKKSHLTHTRLESALDYQYGKLHGPAAREDYRRYFTPHLNKKEKEELFALYAEIAKQCNFPPLTKSAFLGAYTMFNAYLPLSFAFLAHQRTVLLKRAFGEEYVQKTNSLLLSTCTRARVLTREFLYTIETASSLPKSLFNKSLLTGKIIE